MVTSYSSLHPSVAGANTGVGSGIVQAIRKAASETGVSFDYLFKTAVQESSLDPSAKASTSSAAGLYQFTGQTWLQMVKNYGGKYGLGTYADHIHVGADGSLSVSDPKWKQAILQLRHDPQISSEMSAELDKENQASLQANVGGKIGTTELYLAHFLGAGGAADFLSSLRHSPQAKAADILPEAAAANPSVFYDKSGNAKSVSQIYQQFASKFQQNATPTQYAQSSRNAVISGLANSLNVRDGLSKITGGIANLASANDVAARSSSLYATMVLAQMKHGDLAAQSALDALRATTAQNKNGLSSFASIV